MPGDYSEIKYDQYKRNRAKSQRRRSRNRQYGLERIKELGVDHEVKNNGNHIIIYASDIATIDYWPGTGKWINRGTGAEARGIKSLLSLLKVTMI